MSFLKTLTFTSLNEERTNPLLRARAKVIENLKDQRMLINDPNYKKLKTSWVKINGDRQYREQAITIRPGWKHTLDGQIAFKVRSGVKHIEFEKGKAAILLGSKDELVPLINSLMGAIQKGELDPLLATSNQKLLEKKIQPKTAASK